MKIERYEKLAQEVKHLWSMNKVDQCQTMLPLHYIVQILCVCTRISSLAGTKRRVAVFTKIYRLCGSDFTTVAVILNGEEINGSRTTSNAL